MAPAVPVGVIFFMNQAFFWVFIGGGAGSMLRYGLSLALAPVQSRFPWATLTANVAACFILGMVLAAHSMDQMSETRRLLLATGLCGGFSTFSTFTADNWQLLQHGHTLTAVLNMFINLSLCMVFFVLGWKIRF